MTEEEEMADDDDASREQYRPFWGNAFEEFDQRLRSYAHRLANGRAYDAEDLVQETACRALIYARNPAEIRNPLSYLLRMMRNVWTDKWARENVANTESLDDLLSTGRDPVVEPVVQRILESMELQEEMGARQGPLNAREKLLLELHMKGYKTKEIAAELGENVRLTRSDLNAVKAKVRYRIARSKATAQD
jgi:RNA polymerase sigma factor (sigma-70 family)